MNAAISIPKTAPLKTRAVTKVFVDADGEVEMSSLMVVGGRGSKPIECTYLSIYSPAVPTPILYIWAMSRPHIYDASSNRELIVLFLCTEEKRKK